MTKRRTPDTIEDALDQAIAYVGIDRVAAIIGKSPAMVRKFADPDTDHHLQLRSAIEINRQLALGGYPQPFDELVDLLADRGRRAALQLAAGLVEDHPAERPLAQATRVVLEAATLIDTVEKAEADGVYSHAEVDELREQIEALQARLPKLKRSLTARAGRGSK
ncbi:phage regulatory CII family protein [Reyranella sp.]|uniref:phage regulatory CII family protein n=1 Tax=Reyranella sp. TaxID=1929291 RepID=UPI003D12B3C5